jgi:hypothetical protein
MERKEELDMILKYLKLQRFYPPLVLRELMLGCDQLTMKENQLLQYALLLPPLTSAIISPPKIKRADERKVSNQKAEEKKFASLFLKDYEPLRILGSGGFGLVFEAKCKSDGRHYAVKRVHLSCKLEKEKREEGVWHNNIELIDLPDEVLDLSRMGPKVIPRRGEDKDEEMESEQSQG